MPKYIHPHCNSQPIKALIVSPLITSLSAVFPFLHSLTCPYLLSLSSRERPLSTGDKENRGGGKKEQQQGGMRSERRRGETESLICGGTHTHIRTHKHRGHCSAVLPRGPVITEAETDERVAPLFFPRSSFHLERSPLPPCLPELLHSLINRRFRPEKKKKKKNT